jgi:hypothetical protein
MADPEKTPHVVLNPIERARTKPRSRALAIRAKCWDCCGGGQDPGTRRTIAECTVYHCPLHALRPYQPDDDDEPENAQSGQ